MTVTFSLPGGLFGRLRIGRHGIGLLIGNDWNLYHRRHLYLRDGGWHCTASE